MPRKKIRLKLNTTDINNTINILENYKKKILNACLGFCMELSRQGIEIAYQSIAENPLARYVVFFRRFNTDEAGASVIVIGTNKDGLLTRRWIGLDEYGNEIIKTADISPLLMVEFGAGPNVKNEMNIPGVGRGTFPNQTHAFEDSWWYKDLSGVWHETSGEMANMPMYNAYVEMQTKIFDLAKQYFGGIW